MKTILNCAAISDTHGKHNFVDQELRSKKLDILIHAGDGSNSKIPSLNNNEVRDVLFWMSSLTHIPTKIYVPGNHDTAIQAGYIKKEEFPDIHILIEEELIIPHPARTEIKIFGSPYTPTFGVNWAYNCKRGKIQKHWNRISMDSDIVVTHGPPYGILDIASNWNGGIESTGCKNLLTTIKLVQPSYHIFGHIHNEKGCYNYGTRTLGETLHTIFINASITDLDYRAINPPIYFEI